MNYLESFGTNMQDGVSGYGISKDFMESLGEVDESDSFIIHYTYDQVQKPIGTVSWPTTVTVDGVTESTYDDVAGGDTRRPNGFVFVDYTAYTSLDRMYDIDDYSNILDEYDNPFGMQAGTKSKSIIGYDDNGPYITEKVLARVGPWVISELPGIIIVDDIVNLLVILLKSVGIAKDKKYINFPMMYYDINSDKLFMHDNDFFNKISGGFNPVICPPNYTKKNSDNTVTRIILTDKDTELMTFFDAFVTDFTKNNKKLITSKIVGENAEQVWLCITPEVLPSILSSKYKIYGFYYIDNYGKLEQTNLFISENYFIQMQEQYIKDE